MEKQVDLQRPRNDNPPESGKPVEIQSDSQTLLVLRSLFAFAWFALGLYLVVTGQYRDASMKVPDLLWRLGQQLLGLLLLIGLLGWFTRSRFMGNSEQQEGKAKKSGGMDKK